MTEQTDSPRTPQPKPHPTLARLTENFTSQGLSAAEFRGQTTVIVPAEKLLAVMTFLRDDPQSAYDLLSDVFGIDYLGYPKSLARFAVVYNLLSTTLNHRIFIKVLLNPTLDTTGILDDPALHIPSVCHLWPGAEWNERETFDMFGIHFDNHPDFRRILTWKDFPAHPLRKDYPLTGRGERQRFRVIGRDSA